MGLQVDLGDLVAIAALLVSAWSLWKTNAYNRRQNELSETTERLNRLLIERESAEAVGAKKADIGANLIKIGKSDFKLRVFNRGLGTARNVRLIDLDGDESSLIPNEVEQKFPLPILERHQSADLIAAFHMGSKLRMHIKLMWDDDTGSDFEKELTPSL